MSSSVQRHRQAILLIGSIAMLGAALLALSSARGLGLSPDSTIYLGAARSLAHGQGYSLPSETGAFMPVVHYPPLYSILLAGASYLGVDPLAGARWFNVGCLALLVSLSGLMVWHGTASLFWSGVAAMMVAVSFPNLLVHSMAWSEPLFLVLLLAAAWALLQTIRRFTWMWLIGAALACGLAVTVRYAGFAAIPAGVIALLWQSAQPRRQKLFSAAVFLSLGLTPIGFWLLRNFLVSGSSTNRRMVFHPLSSAHLEQLLNTLSSWGMAFWHAAPELQLLAAAVSLAAIAGLWRIDRRPPTVDAETMDGHGIQVLAISGCFVGGYLLLLWLTISYLDYQTPLDSRILSPGFLFTLLMIAAAGYRWFGRQPSKTAFSLAVIMLVGLMSSQIALSVPWLEQLHDQGVGYNHRGWVESTLLRQLRNADPASRIISNAPDVIYALLDRPSAMIPRKLHTDTRLPNIEFAAQLAELQQRGKTTPTLVVVFNAITWRWYLPSASELESLLPLRPILRTEEGVIYRIV